MLNIPEFHLPSPLDILIHPDLKIAEVEIRFKRDDKIHSEVSGNKWRKLKYNLSEAISQGHSTILTFGGGYSNHIYATAKACQLLGLKSIGIIRGDYFPSLSPTLQFAQSCGMTLKFVSKKQFEERDSSGFKKKIGLELGDFYMVPEGGGNTLGVKGCAEILSEINWQFDTVVAPCGTGTTLAGLIKSLKPGQTAIGVSVLKDGGSIEERIKVYTGQEKLNWEILHGYEGRGYAKVDKDLHFFKADFEAHTGILLDYVYTSKMMYALFSEVKRGRWKPGSRLLVIHTGGLQGNDGFTF